jgi:cephalosporin-C deacetylase-like acetyl esterase
MKLSESGEKKRGNQVHAAVLGSLSRLESVHVHVSLDEVATQRITATGPPDGGADSGMVRKVLTPVLIDCPAVRLAKVMVDVVLFHDFNRWAEWQQEVQVEPVGQAPIILTLPD